MFEYNSVQTHSDFKNGKNETKTRRVTIKGKSGYKIFTIRKSGKTKKVKKRLTKKEINCIRKCQFIPGLFNECIYTNSIQTL
jgi:hypothetical protein